MDTFAVPLAANLVLAVLAAGLVASLGGLLWTLVALRGRRQALEVERTHHEATRDQVQRLETLELIARKLAGVRSERALLEVTAEAGVALLGSRETAVVLRAADDLLVTRNAGTQSHDAHAVHELAQHALERRSTVREATRDHRDRAYDGGSMVATPLREGERLLGALVVRTAPAAGGSGSVEPLLIERLAPHVAHAAARLDAVTAASTGSGPGHVPSPPGPGPVASPVVTAAPSLGSPEMISVATGATPAVVPAVDLAALVRAAAARVRSRAAAQGADRRVAVLAPPRAVSLLPDAELTALVFAAFDAVLDTTEPGSNIAVELLVMDGGWELVLTHAGSVIEEEGLLVSGLRGMVDDLGGGLDSGEGAGVARIRIELPDDRDAVQVGSAAHRVGSAAHRVGSATDELQTT